VETQFIETARECLASGERLVEDAKTLNEWSSSPTSLALAILAEEEFAKGFLLFLVGEGVLYWNTAIRQATKDHCCKHLLSELMQFAAPDFDEIHASFERCMARHEAMMKLKLFDEMSSLRLDVTRNYTETT
jgi:AbiV family abortive infection protein